MPAVSPFDLSSLIPEFNRSLPYQQTETVLDHSLSGYQIIPTGFGGTNPPGSIGPFIKPVPPAGVSPNGQGGYTIQSPSLPSLGSVMGGIPNPIAGTADTITVAGKALLWYGFFIVAFLLLGYILVTGSANPTPVVVKLAKGASDRRGTKTRGEAEGKSYYKKDEE